MFLVIISVNSDVATLDCDNVDAVFFSLFPFEISLVLQSKLMEMPI